jgi:hypothetical protein
VSRGLALDLPAHLEAVHARHHRVDQHQVGVALADHPERLGAIVGHEHVHVLGRKLGLEQRNAARRVVDQEDTRAHTDWIELLLGVDRSRKAQA